MITPKQQELIDKYRKIALDWHNQHAKPVQEEITVVNKVEYEKEDTSVEVQLIEKIETIINQSHLDDPKKVIFLGALKNSKNELLNGKIPESLPNVVRNLAQKEEIGSSIKYLCENMHTGGQNYAYLWGLK